MTDLERRNGGARYWALLLLLLLSGVVINAWERIGEVQVPRQELRAFPDQFGSWKQFGPDDRFDPATESLLRADDYVSRSFVSPSAGTASLYIGYYSTQRGGATYHSPLNCLPGSGWTMGDYSLVRITPSGTNNSFDANRYIIQNGNDRELMIYWYQGRGRAIASEYWGKIYTVIDSMRRRRSDGAMVRIAVPVRESDEKSSDLAIDLASRVAAVLPEFVPN